MTYENPAGQTSPAPPKVPADIARRVEAAKAFAALELERFVMHGDDLESATGTLPTPRATFGDYPQVTP